MANLIFEDNFNGEELDLTIWSRCPEWYRHDSSKWDDSLSYLDGEGHLVLAAKWDEKEQLVRSGAVRSAGKYTSGLGYYEASMLLPKSMGTWGAFWLMVGDVSAVDGTSVSGVEIDVVESIRNEKGVYQQAMHWDGYGEHHKSTANVCDNEGRIDIYDGKFHLFGCLRGEEDYIFYVDRTEVWRTKAAGISKEEGFLKFSVESACWAGAKTEESIASLPSKVLIDYVRVWDSMPNE